MKTYVNGYDLEVKALNDENEEIDVKVTLRLTTSGQIALKKRWKESTTSTLFAAADDIERFVDVLDRALRFPGSTNAFKSGEELADAMASSGLLGLKNRQRIMTAIGAASGIFDESEQAMINDKVERAVDGMFSGEATGDDEGDEGNE